MFEKILRAKHWSIFITVFIIPMIVFIVWYAYLMVQIFQLSEGPQGLSSDPIAEFEFMMSQFSYMFPVIFILSGVLYAWFWSIGVTLQKYLHPDVQLKSKLFKFCVIGLLASMLILIFGMNKFMGFTLDMQRIETPSHDLPAEIIAWIPIFFILYFFLLFAQVYSLYFMAKTIKSGVLNRRARFSDYIGEFFLLWFWPIGVWFLQPAINKIVETEFEEHLIIRD